MHHDALPVEVGVEALTARLLSKADGLDVLYSEVTRSLWYVRVFPTVAPADAVLGMGAAGVVGTRMRLKPPSIDGARALLSAWWVSENSNFNM